MSTQTKLAGAALLGLLSVGTLSACTSNTSMKKDETTMAGEKMGEMQATAEKHGCAGQNACKGQGGCETGDNGCAGKNSCKGKGGCATK